MPCICTFFEIGSIYSFYLFWHFENTQNGPNLHPRLALLCFFSSVKMAVIPAVVVYDQIDMNEANPMLGHKWSHIWEPKTLKLGKMAFIGQETVRKQQRHNFLWGKHTLIAVFEHFNPFIDLKINFHINPYNLARRLLRFWAPCVQWTSLAGVRKMPHVSNAFEEYTSIKPLHKK